MNGMKQDVNGTSDGKTRLVNAFQNLISWLIEPEDAW